MQLIALFSAVIALIAGASYGTLTAINEPPPEPMRATILVGGDMMFDRYIRRMMRRHGSDHPFSCIKDVLAEADLVVANLEGPVTTNSSVSEGSVVGSPENYTFTFAPEIVPMLARHNVGLVNLGNNHIMNFGGDGLAQTLSFLDEGGIAHFGAPVPDRDPLARRDIGGMPFSFVSWSEWTGPDADATVAEIVRERVAGRIVVVYAHWGDEYVAPPERVKRLARRFAESGAAIVIGSHPHIVQEREDHAGVPIYYSLGNLVFDQYWEDAVRDGLFLRLRFSDGRLTGIDEMPTRLERDGRVCLR